MQWFARRATDRVNRTSCNEPNEQRTTRAAAASLACLHQVGSSYQVPLRVTMKAFHAIAAAAMAFALVPFAVNECSVYAFAPIGSRRSNGNVNGQSHQPTPTTITRRPMKKDDIDRIEIATIEQAQELRRRARALKAEAEAAERKLRDESNARKREKDAEMDAFIDELVAAAAVNQTDLVLLGAEENGGILSDGSDEVFKMKRVDAIVKMLQSYPETLSPAKLLRIVERIHERENVAADAGNWMRPTALGEMKKANVSQVDAQKVALGAGLGGLAQALIDAIEIIEEGGTGSEYDNSYDNATGAQSPSSKPPPSDVDISAQRADNTLGSRNRFALAGSSAAAPKLRSRLKELHRADEEISKRNFALFSKRLELLRRGSNATLTTLQRNNTGASNSTFLAAIKDFVEVPNWLPNAIVPFLLLDRKPINKNDTQQLREEVLAGSPFFCTGWESCGYATIFRGNFVERRQRESIEAAKRRAAALRGANNTLPQLSVSSLENDRISSSAFQIIQSRFSKSGLDRRLQLFLLQDPDERRNEQGELPPAILAVPSSIQPMRGTEYRLSTKILMTLATIYTTINFAISSYALNSGSFFESLTTGKSIRVLKPCLSLLGGGIASLLVIYESARYAMARRRRISLGLPIPMPSLRIGTLGSRIQLRSFPKARKDLLDVALSGPVVVVLLSLLMIIGGLHLTITATPTALAKMPAIPASLVCKRSFLISFITMKMCPKLLMQPLSQPVPVHPLFLTGMSGLIFSAISLLPIGRLDGGRAMLAAFGRRNAALASFLSLLILFISAANGSATVSVFSAFLILLYHRKAEVLCSDEVTGVGPARLILFTLLLSLTGLTLAPFPGGFI